MQLSIFKNVLIVLSNTDSSCYFSRPNNMAFHDLTKGKVVPLKAKEVLGLSRNFIPTKRHTARAEDLEKSQFEFRRDAHLKTFFAGNPMDHKPSTLYVKSLWRPLPNQIPQEVDRRLCKFFRALNLLFKAKLAQPNLLPFQKKILTWLKQHKSWVIANTDKNLGPCVVELDQYVLNATVHLNDKSTYEKLTEEEAKAEGLRLFKEIWRWTCFSKAKGTITDDEAKYIRKDTSANL